MVPKFIISVMKHQHHWGPGQDMAFIYLWNLVVQYGSMEFTLMAPCQIIYNELFKNSMYI